MAEKTKETKTVDSSRRGFLSKSAVGAGAALTGTMLGAINNGAKADGDPIPLGGYAHDRMGRCRWYRV